MDVVSEIGAWSPELFERFRAAKGELRRKLLGLLVRQNFPLIKKLVGQICGISEDSAGAIRFQGKIKVKGAAVVDYDDLMQAGHIGMAEAIQRFDPTKGRISGIARWRILYEIQKLYKKDHFIHVPDGRESERPGVSFVDDQEALDRMSLEREETLLDVYSVTQEQIAECHRTGEWPETPEAWGERFNPKAIVTVPVALPLDSLTAFLRSLKPATSARVANADLWLAYLAHTPKPDVDKRTLVSAARVRFKSKDKFIRTKYAASERALSGFRL